MKYEIELTAFHKELLSKIASYMNIEEKKLAAGIIINSIEKFDSDMCEYIEQNLPDSYYDDYSGRYIE